ncbi:amidase [soil metagenome]
MTKRWSVAAVLCAVFAFLLVTVSQASSASPSAAPINTRQTRLAVPTDGGWATFAAPGYSGVDLNGDGDTDTTDLGLLAAQLGLDSSSDRWPEFAPADAAGNADGVLDVADVAAVSRRIVYSTAPFELMEASVLDMQKALNAGVITSVSLTQQYLDRIDAYDKTLNSLIAVNPDALELAAASDAVRAATGSRGMLEGIPVIVKDNFDTEGMPTTAGCTCLRDNVTATDSVLVAKLRAEGAIILAKANMSEFAIDTTTHSSLGGQTHNPFLLSETPGGSSGGTGASISANLGAFGLGTDTGGSIRIPAAYTALVGIRPTLGLTSRSGIIPLALSQDTGGPMARTVTDAALALDAVAGDDAADPITEFSLGHIPASYAASLDPTALDGARVGLVDEAQSSDRSVRRLMAAAIATLEAAGATVVDVSLPDFDTLVGFHGAATNEFAAELNEYLSRDVTDSRVPYRTLQQIVAAGDHGTGLGLVALSQVSAEASAAGMLAHSADQQTVRDALTAAMRDYNVTALVYPSTESTASGPAGSNNRLSALSGYPAISLPMGFAEAADGSSARVGTPANIEFLGAAWSEPVLIGYGYAFEQASSEQDGEARHAPDLFPALG